jgi:hypothetical protein
MVSLARRTQHLGPSPVAGVPTRSRQYIYPPITSLSFFASSSRR